MIGIGINENVGLGKDTTVNRTKGWLELQLKQNGGLTEDERLTLGFNGEEIPEEITLKQTVFPPKRDAYDKGQRVGFKTAAQVNLDIQKHMKWLACFLEIYVSNEVIEKEFGKSKITEWAKAKDIKDYTAILSDDAKLGALYTIIYEKFVELLNKYKIIESKTKFRIKLWRQSATNTYTTIPTGRDIWIEPMNVPKDETGNPIYKVLVTDYDKTPFKNSLLNRTSKEVPTADIVAPTEVDITKSIFTAPSDGVFPDNLPDAPII